MENIQSRIHCELIANQAQEIAELKNIIAQNLANHHAALQKTITYYENMLALMPGSVYWLDTNNVYLGCNDIQAEQIKLSSRHEIVGKTTKDLLCNVEQACVVDALNQQVMNTGISYSEIERGILPSGEERVYYSQKVPLRDEKNEVIGLLGISIDITELKQTEAALTIAKELAEGANKAKVEFIANMSHDIRTPLNGVIGMSRLLEEQLTYPEHKQFAHWINQSGEQLLGLLNSILDVVSAENMNECDIKEETFDLRQCIEDIVHLERPTTVLKRIELNVEIDERAPRYIVADRVKLHRVLLNLLGNAIKFTEAGFITLDVRLVDFNGEKSYLQFQVIDTGIGISIEHHSEVFDRFFRANASYDGVYSGHGVGLHIAHSYVKLLGGELNFTSQPGMGTTFYFDLPVSEVNMEDSIDESISSDTTADNCYFKNHNGSVPHILLVEDNVIALHMVELIANQAGCIYSSAINGEDALTMIKSTRFDLVITDIGLPGVSGYELTESVREWEVAQGRPAVPIVGLTAHAHAKNACLQSGMNNVFCKPLNLEMMQSILAQYISYNVNESALSGECNYGLPGVDAELFNLEQFPLLDLEHAIERIGNKSVLLDMLQLMITQEIPKDGAALREAFAISDWNGIKKLAHKMKGGAVYCGTFKMQYACQYLERYIKSGQSVLQEQLYHQLLLVLSETKDEIYARLLI